MSVAAVAFPLLKYAPMTGCWSLSSTRPCTVCPQATLAITQSVHEDNKRLN